MSTIGFIYGLIGFILILCLGFIAICKPDNDEDFGIGCGILIFIFVVIISILLF